jgi:hypothetical protein
VVPLVSPGPTVAGFDPIGVREGDPEHRRSHLRASPRDRSMTALSPSGEYRQPASSHTTSSLLSRSAGTPATALALTSFGGDRGGGRKKCTRVCGELVARRFCCAETHARPSITDGRCALICVSFGRGG